jgi:hypothetical protein
MADESDAALFIRITPFKDTLTLCHPVWPRSDESSHCSWHHRRCRRDVGHLRHGQPLRSSRLLEFLSRLEFDLSIF